MACEGVDSQVAISCREQRIDSGMREGCPQAYARERLHCPREAQRVESVILLFGFAFGAGSESDVVEHDGEFAQGEAVPCDGLIRVDKSESPAPLQLGSIGVVDFLIPLGVERVSDPVSQEPRSVIRTGLSLEGKFLLGHLWQACEQNPFFQRSVLPVHEREQQMSRFAPSGSRLDS